MVWELFLYLLHGWPVEQCHMVGEHLGMLRRCVFKQFALRHRGQEYRRIVQTAAAAAPAAAGAAVGADKTGRRGSPRAAEWKPASWTTALGQRRAGSGRLGGGAGGGEAGCDRGR